MLRCVQDLVRRAHLDEQAMLHHGDPISDVGDHAEIMGDEQHAGVVARLKLLDQLQDLRLCRDIERRGRLVGDQNLRIERQRHRDHCPLTLTAGEFMGVAVDDLLGVGQMDIIEEGDGLLSPSLLPPELNMETETPRRSGCRWS